MRGYNVALMRGVSMRRASRLSRRACDRGLTSTTPKTPCLIRGIRLAARSHMSPARTDRR